MERLIALDSRHREAVTTHLLSLGADDRADRFTVAADDAYVRRYADGIGYARDILLGALRGRRLVGMAHAAVYVERGEVVSEVGISIDAGARKQGLGRQLLLAAIEAAQRCNVCRVVVLFRATNSAMAALARSIGGRVVREGSDASAVFALPAQPNVPLTVHRDGAGREVVQALHPREHGRVLLVHGAGGDSYQWLPGLLPRLWEAGFSVCAPTLPGHGRGGDPADARLDDLLACVTDTAEAFDPTLVVGHSMGGYLVQRHLETHTAPHAALLASLPPEVPAPDALDHVKAELHCADTSAVLDRAIAGAPPVDVAAAGRTPLLVLGGTRDRVVPMPWVRHTAGRYGVEAGFVEGGHRLMMGRAASEVAGSLSGIS